MNKFAFYNDTQKQVHIHPATFKYGCKCTSILPIKHMEYRVFDLPQGTMPMLKVWDYGDRGLGILVTSLSIEDWSDNKNEI
jgi:hypothetical protein